MDLLSKLIAEAKAQPDATVRDPYGNAMIRLRPEPSRELSALAYDDEPSEVEAALHAAVFDEDYDFAGDGRNIEPDHPDSILVKMGLI